MIRIKQKPVHAKTQRKNKRQEVYLLIWKELPQGKTTTLEFKRQFTNLQELHKFSLKLEMNKDVIEIYLYQQLVSLNKKVSQKD